MPGDRVGTGYVEIKPQMSSGFKSTVEKAMPDGGGLGAKFGGAFGSKMQSAVSAGAVAMGNILADAAEKGIAAVGDLAKQAVKGFADFEQLSGGVKKLFGDDVAKTVMANADKAFMTAGMSANQYMEQATSFSASLLQSVGGNAAEAASLADTAMRAISDNINTFGTDMSSVQNAFQGFAKQNYTINLMSAA